MLFWSAEIDKIRKQYDEILQDGLKKYEEKCE